MDENAGICSRSLLWNASSILQVSASSYWGASWCFLYLFCDLKHVHLLLINLFESSITLMLHIFNIFVELVHSTFVDNLLSQLVIQIWNSFLSAEWRSGQDGGGEDCGRDRDGRNEGCFSVCNVHFSLPTSHTRCCWLNAHMSAIYHCCIVVGISLFHQFPSGILSSVAWCSCVINCGSSWWIGACTLVLIMWESRPSFWEIGQTCPRGTATCDGQVRCAREWAPPLDGTRYDSLTVTVVFGHDI